MLILVLTVSTGACLWYLHRDFFAENPRFTLQKVEVFSPNGWWNGREDEVLKHLNLQLTRTNLFELDLSVLRKQLEAEPGIEQATVARKLPDRLTVHIKERIPRGILIHPQSRFLIEENGIVMRRDRCMDIGSGLPLIFGFKQTIPPFGEKFEELLPAVRLIMLTRTRYPSIRLIHIDASQPDFLMAKLYYRENNLAVYTAYLPLRGTFRNGRIENTDELRRSLESGLKKLLSAIPQAQRPGETRRIIDTRYEGSAILK